jgi:hypothetical protein
MKRRKITEKSSSIAKIEFDLKTNILLVEFMAGSKYLYKDVLPDVANELFEAESTGKYFAANIKDQYDTEKVEGATTNPPRPYWPYPTGEKP